MRMRSRRSAGSAIGCAWVLERRDKTLRTLAARQLLVFGLATLALAGLTFGGARFELGQVLDSGLAARAAAARQAQQEGGRQAVIDRLDRFARDGSRIGYAVHDPRGGLLRGPRSLPALSDGWAYIDIYDPDEDRIDPFRSFTFHLSDGTRITLLADRDFLKTFDRWFWLFAVLAVALLFGSVAVAQRQLERRVSDRLASVSATALAIIDGDLDQRLEVRPEFPDEFDLLSSNVNKILDRMYGYVEELRLMSGYLTHDLRAPLAELASELRRREASARSEGEVRLVLTSAADRCEEIIDLFGQILQIGEVDAGSVRANGSAFDLSDLVTTLAEDHIPVAEDSGHILSLDVDPSLTMFGRKELIGQALMNLISNALRHTPSGTNIRVTLRRDGASALLGVADDGESLPAAERAALLNPARRSAAGELGRKAIGLKLTRAAIMAHGGTLALIDNRPGLLAEITLPLSD